MVLERAGDIRYLHAHEQCAQCSIRGTSNLTYWCRHTCIKAEKSLESKAQRDISLGKHLVVMRELILRKREPWMVVKLKKPASTCQDRPLQSRPVADGV